MKSRCLLLLLLVLTALVLCFCACDSTPAEAETTDHGTADGTTAAPTETPTEESTEAITPEATEPPSETETDPPAAEKPYTLTATEGENGLDFIIDFPAGKDLVILQLADIQLQTLKGTRSAERRSQLSGAYFTGFPAGKRNDHEFRAWRYVEEAIEKVKPDLIVLTGDNVFGETDDSGKDWLEFVARMDSYGIPWCPVFGNHDNESGKGVLWQISQLEQSEYCIFKQGTVSGNSNYNLLIRQGGEAKYLLYMMDSNGCKTRSDVAGAGLMPDNPDIDLIVQDAGFCDDQLEWMKASGNSVRSAYGEVPSLIFFHIPDYSAWKCVKNAYGEEMDQFPFYPDHEGDAGFALESLGGYDNGPFWSYAKEIGCIGMFVGHRHKVATSINCEGIRVTYGLKTGTYDYHDPSMLGSTKITLSETAEEMGVEYVPTELSYNK